MNKVLYINTRDYQGGNWFVGAIFTIKEWKDCALVWCDLDGNEELYKLIKKQKNNEKLIDMINDLWSMNIVKYDENNNEHKILKEERNK